MKGLLGWLFVSLLGGLWLSLKGAQCQISPTGILRPNMPYCYNTSSGKTCFTTLLVNNSRIARKPFEEASHWCKTYVPGSSLIVINSLEIQRAVESFIIRQVLESDSIIMDAQMLSANESQKWSWVNYSHTYTPDLLRDISHRAKEFNYGACIYIESKSVHRKSLSYCFGNVTSLFRYICELSDSKSNDSYRQGNKSHVASEVVATWFDARKECLRLNGDLASITDLRTIIYWTSLPENQKYWIGLHRNKWIWNSTGAALTYTNWKNGFPEESSDKQCICFSPKCGRNKEKTTKCEADYDRKWSTCNCSHNYTIVCQKEILSTTSADIKSSSSPGLFDSFNTKEMLLILLFIVAVVFIVFVIVLVIRKCKNARGNEGSHLNKTNQNESVSPEYETMVRDKRPSDDIVPIYTELESIQHSMPSNSTIYANAQPTGEAVEMDISVAYVDPHEI